MARLFGRQESAVTSGTRRPTYRCSFCGKGQEQVEKLIAGPGGIYICDECVAQCNEIITEYRAQHPRTPTSEQ